MHIYIADLSNCSNVGQSWFSNSNDSSISSSSNNDTLASNLTGLVGIEDSRYDPQADPDYLSKLHGLTVFVVGVIGVLIVASLLFCMFYKNDRMADLICRCRTAEEVYDPTGGSNIFFQSQGINLKPLVTTLPILVAGAAGPIPMGTKRKKPPRSSGQESPEITLNDPLEGMLSGRKLVIQKKGTPGEGSEAGDPLSPDVFSPTSSDPVTSPFVFSESGESADSNHDLLTVPDDGATFAGF